MMREDKKIIYYTLKPLFESLLKVIETTKEDKNKVNEEIKLLADKFF